MNEPTTQTMAAFAAARAAKPRSRIQTLPVEFTGTGSGYFRIWIVNLLLILITLSLYTPWARARKLRYFYCHTLVDGHPLAFHGDARKMFHGYLLVGAMAVVYWVAGLRSFFGVFLKTAGVTAACWAMVTVSSSIVVISVLAFGRKKNSELATGCWPSVLRCRHTWSMKNESTFLKDADGRLTLSR